MRCSSSAPPGRLERLRAGSRARGFALSRRTSPSGPRVRARRPRPGAGAARRQRAGNRRARRGADDIDARRGELGRCTRSGPASHARRGTASRQNRPAEDRVGGTDRSRGYGRQSCRAWMHQPGRSPTSSSSPRTPSTSHLRHVFEKLGVNSRVHLTRLVAGRSLQSPGDPHAERG